MKEVTKDPKTQTQLINCLDELGYDVHIPSARRDRLVVLLKHVTNVPSFIRDYQAINDVATDFDYHIDGVGADKNVYDANHQILLQYEGSK